MNRYTFVMEIKGGTHIEQVTSKNVSIAKSNWVNTLSNQFIPNVSDEELELLQIYLQNFVPSKQKTSKILHFSYLCS